MGVPRTGFRQVSLDPPRRRAAEEFRATWKGEGAGEGEGENDGGRPTDSGRRWNGEGEAKP